MFATMIIVTIIYRFLLVLHVQKPIAGVGRECLVHLNVQQDVVRLDVLQFQHA